MIEIEKNEKKRYQNENYPYLCCVIYGKKDALKDRINLYPTR